MAQQFLVPTQAERDGDLSDYGTNLAIPHEQHQSDGEALLATYYPLPNVSGSRISTMRTFASTPARTDGADVRIDQTISSKQSAYARFSRKNITSNFANPFLPNDMDSIHNRSLLVSHTYAITPKLLNEFRFGFTNVTTSVGFAIEGAAALQQLDLQGVDISQHPTTHAFPTFNFSAGTGFTPIGRDKTGVTQSKTMQFSDNVTYTLGKHTLKGGLDVRRVRYFDLESFAPAFASDDFGSFTFPPSTFGQQGVFTGNAFGDFLEGAPTTLAFAVSSPDVGGTATQYSLFAQDEFQVNSRLTLSYGLRWQILPGFQEDGGNLANFDQNTNSIVVPDSLAAYLAQQNIQSSNLAFQQSFNACNLNNTALPCTKYVTASQDGLPQSLRNTYKGNFQPRVSVAYRPFNDTKTVVRAGFRDLYDDEPGAALVQQQRQSYVESAYVLEHEYGGSEYSADPVSADGAADGGRAVWRRQPGSGRRSELPRSAVEPVELHGGAAIGQRYFAARELCGDAYVPAECDGGSEPDCGEHYSVLRRRCESVCGSASSVSNWFSLLSTFNAGKANYRALELEATRHMAMGSTSMRTIRLRIMRRTTRAMLRRPLRAR